MTILRRIIKSGLLSFTRNGLVSWAAVLVMTVTLSVITSLLLLQAVLNFSLDQIQNKVDVTIYFTPSAEEERILVLKESLLKLPEVAEVDYTSSAEALAIFRDRHQDDYPTIQALEEINENPLGAYLNVRARDVAQYESIANFMKSDDATVLGSANIIDKVNYYQNKSVIDRLNSIISGANKLGFIVTLLLVVISIAVTLNTIRLTIFISKEEIAVMRLVGASKVRIQGPFMVEGAIYGAIATILTTLLFLPATGWVGKNMTAFLGMNVYNYYVSNIIQIFLIILLTGIVLGTLSSYLAVRRYLNK